VAVGQCAALRGRGHDAQLWGGWLGDEPPPDEVQGVHARLFPLRRMAPVGRFSGFCSVAMLKELRRSATDYDVAHVHFARDLVALTATRALRKASVPYLLQTHGMVTPDRRLTARVVDHAATRGAMRRAAQVLSLNTDEDVQLEGLGLDLPVSRCRNGIAMNDLAVPLTADEPAQSRGMNVLFLGRLHPRKRVMDFVRAAELVIGKSFNVKFSIIGADDGDLEEVFDFLDERPEMNDAVEYLGAMSRTAAMASLAKADVLVLPSVDEPFPMTLLESLALGVPIISTTGCSIASELVAHDSALVVDPGHRSIASAVERILRDERLRSRLSRNGRRMADSEYNMKSVVDTLESQYRAAISSHRSLIASNEAVG